MNGIQNESDMGAMKLGGGNYIHTPRKKKN